MFYRKPLEQIQSYLYLVFSRPIRWTDDIAKITGGRRVFSIKIGLAWDKIVFIENVWEGMNVADNPRFPADDVSSASVNRCSTRALPI